MRNCTFGAKALSIRPPATITPLKMVTGRAPKLSTQALQTGPEGKEVDRQTEGEKRDKKSKGVKEINGGIKWVTIEQKYSRNKG